MNIKADTLVVPDEQKMAVLRRVCAKMAHDINNLLGAIEGYSTFAASALAPGSQARADIEDVRASAAKGAELTGRLSLFAGRRTLARSELSPAGLLEAAAAGRGAGWEKINFRTAANAAAAVNADEDMLKQALAELLRNARYSCQAGGEVTAGAEDVSVPPERNRAQKPAAGNAAFVRFYVADSGPGPGAADLPRLFEPFFSTRSARGLGLAAVYGAALLHGGWAECLLPAGGGCEFSFYIPAGI